jgi:ubiquinone/menaquinone biosynthesis C-methylase UbiE
MRGRLKFDEEGARAIEKAYLTADVIAQRQATLNHLALEPGERVLDIGSGPGLLAWDMAQIVGGQGQVAGIDISDSMLTLARRRCEGIEWVEFMLGDASALPFDDGSFDVAVATQVYEYIDHVEIALAELYRALRPGGRAAIIDTDWRSFVLHTDDPERMQRVLAAWDDHLAHPSLPQILGEKLRDAGFALDDHVVIPLVNSNYSDDSYSHNLIGVVADFVVGHHAVTQAEAEAWAAEQRSRDARGAYFFSINRDLFLVRKPG